MRVNFVTRVMLILFTKHCIELLRKRFNYRTHIDMDMVNRAKDERNHSFCVENGRGYQET